MQTSWWQRASGAPERSDGRGGPTRVLGPTEGLPHLGTELLHLGTKRLRLGTELPSLGMKPLQSHAGMSPSCAFLESDEINVKVAARLATSFFSCCKSEAEPRSGDQSQVKALLVCQQRRRESLQQDDARSLWRSRRPWTHHGETRGPAGHQVLSATVLTCLSHVLPLVSCTKWILGQNRRWTAPWPRTHVLILLPRGTSLGRRMSRNRTVGQI